jgi:hypothetical protein
VVTAVSAAAGPHEASVNAAAVPRVATASGERALEKSYKPKKLLSPASGNVNDTRRRPATVAVAVCIGSYARSIFVDV